LYFLLEMAIQYLQVTRFHEVQKLILPGFALDSLGNYKDALKYLDKALAIDTNDEFALNNIGWALNSLGNYNGAIQYSDKALTINPKDSIALNNIG
jgi:uncharacterized protein